MVIRAINQQLLKRMSIYLVVVIASFLAAQPLLQPHLPETADGTLFLYRLGLLDHTWQYEGLWVRYSPQIAYGYGAPLFNYFSPASLFLPLFTHLLGLSLIGAWLAGMLLYIVLGGIGMYHLGRQWSNDLGGVIAAIAYVYSPYLLFNVYTRGTISETAALAILPWVLWAFGRLVVAQNRVHFLLATLIYATFILLHNIMTVHGTLLLCGLIVYWIGQSTQRWQLIRYLGAAFLIAIGITSFFWLPAILETSYVQISTVTDYLPHVNVVENLRPISASLSPPVTADTTWMNPEIPITLSWVQIVVAMIGLPFLLLDRSRGWGALLLTLFICVWILTTTPWSAGIWGLVPFIGFTQFPWRVLGLASLLLAILVGASVAAFVNRFASTRHLLVGTVVCAILLYAIPWLFTRYVTIDSPEPIQTVQAFEADTGLLTLGSYAEHLPVWVQDAPPSDWIKAQITTSGIFNRFVPSPSIKVLNSEWGITSTVLSVDVSEETNAEFYWLYVPGFSAEVDGEQVAVSPSSPHGLVSVPLSPGQSEVRIDLYTTPAQQISELISLLSIVILGAIFIRIPRYRIEAVPIQIRISTVPLIVGITFGVFLFKILVVDSGDTIFSQQRYADLKLGALQHPTNPQQQNFDDSIILLGINDIRVKSGDSIMFDVYWTLHSDAIEEDYSSIARLYDTNGIAVAESGSFMPGGIATSNWLPSTYIIDPITIPIELLPPGEYVLRISLHDPLQGQDVPVLNKVGNAIGVEVPVYVFDLPPHEITPSPFPLPNEQSLTEPLRFIVEEPPPTNAQVGDEFISAIVWRSTAPITGDIGMEWVWEGQQIATSSSYDLLPSYAPSEWQVGDIWVGHYRVIIPPTLAAGRYSIGLRLVDSNGNELGHASNLSEMEITVPERNYVVPDFVSTINQVWGNGIRLLGSTASNEQLTLIWQTDAIINQNLRLFAQVLDAEERVLSQTDGVPVNWTRPTTSWDQQEYIVTQHQLQLKAPEAAEIRIGWVNNRTGERVPLNGDNELFLSLDITEIIAE